MSWGKKTTIKDRYRLENVFIHTIQKTPAGTIFIIMIHFIHYLLTIYFKDKLFIYILFSL